MELKLKGLFEDLVITNSIAFIITILLHFTGWKLINAFTTSLLILSALALILGGVFGSLISSVSFHGLDKLLRRRHSEEEKAELVIQRDAASLKEQVKTGKRFVVIGAIILAESIILGFILI